MNQDVQGAMRVLKQGGIVIFPTDTAFGIGCRVDDEKAVERLFKIRNRPKDKAVSILVDTVLMAKKYVDSIPKDVLDNLIEPYWPGALTIVLQSKVQNVQNLVRGGGNTIGVRIPNHSVTRKIIRELGVGILGPSANFSGEKTPYRFEDLDPKLIKLVDYVVPGECSIGMASTVIDCSVEPWKIVREGAIKVQHVILGSISDSRIDSGQARMTEIILYINTASNKEIIIGIRINGKEYKHVKVIDNKKTQAVLPMIDTLLKKHGMSLKDLQAIEVNLGPGSFTGLRVGIAIANTLSFTLNIPINGGKKEAFVEPVY